MDSVRNEGLEIQLERERDRLDWIENRERLFLKAQAQRSPMTREGRLVFAGFLALATSALIVVGVLAIMMRS